MHLGAIIARVLALSLAACALAGPAAADDAGVENRLEVSAAQLDLGEAAPSSVVEGVVTLRNVGRRAIGIVETATTCRCTVASVEPRVVEPGGEIRVAVTLEAPGFAGEERVAEIRLTTSEHQEIVVPVRVRTAPALAVESLEITTLRDGSVACVLEIAALDGALFAMVGAAVNEDPDPKPAARRRLVMAAPTNPDGVLAAVLRLRTDHPLQPTLEVPIGAALMAAGVASAALERAPVRPSPTHIDTTSDGRGPLTAVIELPGWTDGIASTRLSWTNAALDIALRSLELGPTGAVATLEITDAGGGRRSFDRVTLTSPSFESTFRLTVRRGDAAR